MEEKIMKKIAIVGPESTGKSWLSEALASKLNTVWVPEFARTYLNQIERPYEQSDLENIARGQLESEDALQAMANQFLICDTNLLVIEVWSENAFGNCPEWIRNEVRNRKYDLHLLTDVDLPWQPDPLREHPHLRAYFYDIYVQKLKSIGHSFEVVSGLGQARIDCALNLIDHSLTKIY